LARFSSIWQLKAAAITLFVEAAALIGGAGYFVFGIITGQARLLPTLAALAGFTALAAIWFISLGVGLITPKATTRTPAMFAQMIPLSIAFGSTSGENASAPNRRWLVYPKQQPKHRANSRPQERWCDLGMREPRRSRQHPS
jgi:ABC-type multidrug transport system permease subunit